MSTMNISLPDEMRAFVENEVRGGGFSSASEYFRQLVREAKARKEREEVERKKADLTALLLEGLESREEGADASWWSALRADMEAELQKRGPRE